MHLTHKIRKTAKIRVLQPSVDKFDSQLSVAQPSVVL